MKWILVVTVLNAEAGGVLGITTVGDFPTKEECVWEGSVFQQVTLYRATSFDRQRGGSTLTPTPVSFDCIKTGGAVTGKDGPDQSTTMGLWEAVKGLMR